MGSCYTCVHYCSQYLAGRIFAVLIYDCDKTKMGTNLNINKHISNKKTSNKTTSHFTVCY